MAWLPATSVTVAPARSAMARWAGGGIIRSSVATRYQLGLARQAGSVIAAAESVDAPRDLGVGHERGLVGRQSAANEAANFSRSRRRKPSSGGRIGGTGRRGADRR